MPSRPLSPRLASPRSLRRHIALALVALTLAGGLGSLTSAAQADDTDGISGAPADSSGADDRSRFSYQVLPGQHLDDFYIVRNTGTTTQTMKVFATDAYNTDDGSYGLLDTDATPLDSGAWVSFDGGATQLSIPLGPGESRVVPFALDVPAEASPGDHAAGIVTSVTAPSGEILVDRRIATRLYVRVPGDIQAALTISSLTASYISQANPFGGATTLSYTVTNKGNVALAANVVVGVRTYFGIAAVPIVRTELTEMLPGGSRVVTTSVPGVAQLGYLDPYVSIAPTVDAGALDPGPLRVVDRDTVILAPPWWLIALLVAGGAAWLVIRVRRTRNDRDAAAWIAYTEAEALRKASEHASVGVSVWAGVGAPAGAHLGDHDLEAEK
ncbi:MAG: hypothetical protein H7146_02405 [Burkholderiaceae bacterium]|nr:hypothetical protein [Microbacteriaceae bacterium]